MSYQSKASSRKMGLRYAAAIHVTDTETGKTVRHITVGQPFHSRRETAVRQAQYEIDRRNNQRI